MLDQLIIDQLKIVFSKLEKNVELFYFSSFHEKQEELENMLLDLSKTSAKINVFKNEEIRAVPEFYIKYNGKGNGISFVGIPGGHEFTSLILAILNSDFKGKLPDQHVIERIKNLKGPINLKTFISLSCENCPEVVQSLNIMAIYHPDFTHQMINGELVQDEIDRLNIQGVPSVIENDSLIISGKNNLSDILLKLEQHFGVKNLGGNKDLGEYDVVVIGGGPAGASAAIYTSRKGLKTAIVATKLGGQVQETKGIENLISVPYTEGPDLSAKLEAHIKEYPITILEHRTVEFIKDGSLKELDFNSGEFLKTKAIIVATGAKWKQLGIDGEKEYIGRGVAFCAHCDGPYYKDKTIAIVGGGNSGVEAAIDLAGIVKEITLIEFNHELKADQVLVEKLKKLSNVKIISGIKTSAILGDGSKVTGLTYENRETKELSTISLDGVFVQIGLSPNSNFIKDLVNVNKYGEIEIDNKCNTNISGIYAAGDVTTVPYKQIIISMGEGAKAGLTCFEDLILKSK